MTTTTLRTACRAVTLAAVLVLTACGGEHVVDREQWQQDLDEAGYEGTPVELVAPVYENDLCDAGADEIAALLTLEKEEGMLDEDLQRINFENACPDQVGTFEEALAEVESASGTAG